MRVVCNCEKCPYYDDRGYCGKRLLKIGKMGTCEVIWNEYSINFNVYNFPENVFNQIREPNSNNYYIKSELNIIDNDSIEENDAETQVDSREEEMVSGDE